MNFRRAPPEVFGFVRIRSCLGQSVYFRLLLSYRLLKVRGQFYLHNLCQDPFWLLASCKVDFCYLLPPCHYAHWHGQCDSLRYNLSSRFITALINSEGLIARPSWR